MTLEEIKKQTGEYLAYLTDDGFINVSLEAKKSNLKLCISSLNIVFNEFCSLISKYVSKIIKNPS